MKIPPSIYTQKIIFLLSFLFFIFFPFFANGQQGLVPCGGPGQPTCQFCHIFVLFDNILRFIFFKIVPPLAILMIVIAGIYFFFAGTSGDMINKGRTVLKNTLIALIIIYGAWLFVNFFFLLIGVSEWTGLEKGWFVVDCPT